VRLEVLDDRSGIEPGSLDHGRKWDRPSKDHADRTSVLPSAESSHDGISRQQAGNPGDGSPDPVRDDMGAAFQGRSGGIEEISPW